MKKFEEFINEDWENFGDDNKPTGTGSNKSDKKDLYDLSQALVRLHNQFQDKKGLVTKATKEKIDEKFRDLIFTIKHEL